MAPLQHAALAMGIIVLMVFVSATPSTGLFPAGDPRGAVVDPDDALAAAVTGRLVLPIAGAPLVFDLAPNPISHGAVWGLDSAAMGVVSEVRSFHGTSNGDPATLTVTRLGVFALVLAPDPLVVYPALADDPDAGVGELRVARWSQAPPAIPDHPEPRFNQESPASNPAPATAPTNRVARVLVESDYAFYERWTLAGKCPECWRDVQEAVFTVVNELFRRQTGVRMEITSQWACSSQETCRYENLGGQHEMSRWLGVMREYWESRADEPLHEVGHLLIGTDLPMFTGLAGGLVNTPLAYSVAEFLATPAAPGTGLFHSLTAVAHEIGHNFNGVHEEAHAIPAPPPPFTGVGAVHTLMMPSSFVRFQFSDGSWISNMNNVGRIVAAANQQLPPA